MSEFKNSIAQDNVQFPIETVIQPIAGAQYSKAMIFMPLSKASEYLPGVDEVQAGNKIELNANNYGSLTSGLLKTWLVPFFTAGQACELAVVVFDDGEDATITLNTVYEQYKFYAYFKFGIAGTEAYNDLQSSLAQLCDTDPLYSRLWVGTSDENVLTKSSNLITALNTVKADARVIYNPDATINPALAQLGATLAVANPTGTPVGNDVDMLAFNTIDASGATDENGNVLNLSATEKAALDDQKIGYNTWVGDGTENVVTEGSLTLQGNVVGSQWVKSYIEYMCKVKTANYITQRNKFRNNDQYQAILLILSTVVQSFIDLGRLANFVITAPIFSKLTISADSFVIPNAWEANYIDKLRNVAVYGTLYVTQPTK